MLTDCLYIQRNSIPSYRAWATFIVCSVQCKRKMWEQPLFINMKLFLSSTDSFLTWHGVLHLPLVSLSFRQGILLGHAQILTGSRALPCKLAPVHDPSAGTLLSHQPCPVSTASTSPAHGLTGYPPMGNGPPTSDYNLFPDIHTWRGIGRGSSVELCGQLKAGRLLPCSSLRPWRWEMPGGREAGTGKPISGGCR